MGEQEGCAHTWHPRPADPRTAENLFGHCHCLRCGKPASKADLAQVAAELRKVTQEGQPRVLGEYDPWRGI